MEATGGEALTPQANGMFLTIHTLGQDFGEIEPNFYNEFKDEATTVWHLFDAHGMTHEVELELIHPHPVPRITRGLMLLREHYGLTEHHQILFKYFGQKYFQIILQEPVTQAKFPTWHSMSLKLRNAVTFRMTITEDPEVHPHLTLPEDLGDYLSNKGLSCLWLIGENNEKHRCRFQFDPYTWPFPVKFESGWPEVCGINNFRVRDRICFSASNIYSNHALYLTKED